MRNVPMPHFRSFQVVQVEHAGGDHFATVTNRSWRETPAPAWYYSVLIHGPSGERTPATFPEGLLRGVGKEAT